MLKKTTYFLWACLAVMFLFGVPHALGASIFDIEYPIAELGGCADRTACKQYCDDAANGDACLAFAQKYGLADKKTIEKAKVVQEEVGPGGCKGADECHAYCEDVSHEAECVEFGVQKGFMTRAEADRILKPGPGGCRGRACEQYCHDPAHEEECFAYAEANGLIPKEEAKRIREFKKKFKKDEGGPGGCRGERACRAYCEDPEHITECVSFAEEHGFMDKDHAKLIKKTAGKGPGGCKGSDACRAYCDDTAHQEECINFGEENGFMTKEEAARARKFAGKAGPGGCRGEQCRDFCNQAGNEEQCLEFAEREGIIPKEEAARAKKFMAASRDGGPGGCRGVQCRDYCNDPSHQEECFGFAKKQGLITKEEEEEFEAGAKIQEIVKTSGGPGGCKSDDECRNYCTDPSHVEECVAFGATHGGMPPEQVREMLKNFTERRFEARGGPGEFGGGGFEEFERFEQDAGRRFDEFRALEQEFRGKEFPGFSPESGGFPGGPDGGFPGGAPGGFPGGRGGASGEGQGRGEAFAGPGGCTSPAECIKYCTEHRDECFGSGSGTGGHSNEQQQFGGERRDKQFGPPPQLRGGLIKQFEQGDLPEGFHQLPSEEREKFFHDKFPQFNPPQPGQFPNGGRSPDAAERGFFENRESGGSAGRDPQSGREGFPGRPPQEFPGRPEEFPGGAGTFPDRAPEGFPGQQGSFSPQGFPSSSGSREGFMPPEGFHPPEGSFQQQQQGGFPPPSGGQLPPPQGSFNQPPDGTFHSPPESSFTPSPSGSFPPPPSESFSQPPPPSGTFSAPPPPSGSSGSFSSPPPSGSQPPPPPSGFAPITRFFGAILGAFGR